MAHPELDELLDSALKFAQKCLEKYGEFYPFGMSRGTDGQQRADNGWTGSDMPPSQELIDLLTEGYQKEAQAGNITAACLCFDVKLREPNNDNKDAIRCDLEHVEGDSVSVYLPYHKTSTSFDYGTISAEKKEVVLFS